MFYTHIGGNGELVVLLLEGLGLQVVPSNLHVVGQEGLPVSVDPVKHLTKKHFVFTLTLCKSKIQTVGIFKVLSLDRIRTRVDVIRIRIMLIQIHSTVFFT